MMKVKFEIRIDKDKFLHTRTQNHLMNYLQTQYNYVNSKTKSISFFIKFMNKNCYNYTHKFLKQFNVINLSLVDDDIVIASSKKMHYPNHYLVLKIATGKVSNEFWTTNISIPRLKVACVYDSRTNKYWFFNTNTITDLFDLLLSGPRIVTFNGKRFDKPVLVGYGLNEYISENNVKWREIDIFQKLYKKIDFMYSLDTLFKANFNSGRLYPPEKILELNNCQLKDFCKDDVSKIKQLLLLYQSHQLKVPKLIKVIPKPAI